MYVCVCVDLRDSSCFKTCFVCACMQRLCVSVVLANVSCVLLEKNSLRSCDESLAEPLNITEDAG